MRFFAFLLIVLTTSTVHADWRQFRGTDGSGSDASCILPESWSADGDNIAWKIELPGRGPSSPIVVKDRVIVTTATGADQEQLHVLCYSPRDGKQLWQRTFWATGRTFTHKQSTPAAPTPISDGEYVYTFFSSSDLACLDLDGNLIWLRGLGYEHPKAGNDIGMASSPVIVDETVIVQIESQGESFATGINAKTGETRWTKPRLAKSNWASPIAIVSNDSSKSGIALLQNSEGIVAVDPQSGDVLWKLQGDGSTISSSIPGSDQAFVALNGLTAIDVSNPRQEPEMAWEVNKLRPASMSPIMHEEKLYTINGAGVLNCANAENGDIEWSLRLKGRFWATPVIAGDKLIAVNFDGLAQVVDLSGKKGEIVQKIEMGEKVQATPALHDNSMYIKGEQHLWKISSSD